jgi:Putative DNA-binding domain
MQHPLTRTFIVVPADQSIHNQDFANALLNPALAVPTGIRAGSDKRYAVYRNNVTVSLVRAMEANFPAIRKLLGEIYFAGLAREFAQAHPPRSPLMFFYGDEFPKFLELQTDLSEYSYLSDVARLEQLWRQSYHEQDMSCLLPVEIAALDDEQLASLCLKPHPAFALLSSPFAVHSIFSANRSDQGQNLTPVNTPEYVIISRPKYSVETRAVSKGTFTFLKALSNGQSIGAAADEALNIDAELDLTNCISTLLIVGAFQTLEKQG